MAGDALAGPTVATIRVRERSDPLERRAAGMGGILRFATRDLRLPHMLNKIFKAYDVRGIYPEPLNEQDAWQIGFGCARFLLQEAQKDGRTDAGARTVVVGRDMRKSSPSLVRSLKDGMREGGAHVVDVGMVDTPFTYFAANQLKSAGAVQTTASHNPAQYNGFKVSGAGAKPVGQDTGLSTIKASAESAAPGEGP